MLAARRPHPLLHALERGPTTPRRHLIALCASLHRRSPAPLLPLAAALCLHSNLVCANVERLLLLWSPAPRARTAHTVQMHRLQRTKSVDNINVHGVTEDAQTWSVCGARYVNPHAPLVA